MNIQSPIKATSNPIYSPQQEQEQTYNKQNV